MGRPAILAIVTALACASAASAAGAQCRLCSTPTTRPDQAQDSDKVDLDVQTNLNFDQLIVDGAVGNATIHPDGSTSNQGAVSGISPRAMVGTVVLHGQPNRMIRVDLPSRITLHSLSGGEITFDNVVSDLPSVPRLDSQGSLTFRFGGRLHVTGDAEGQYRGDLPITAEYL